MPRPEKYDLRAKVPVDMRLGKIYQNEGQYGPFIRVMAWMREPSENDYIFRSILSDFDLLGQLYQMGFAEAEDKLNDDELPFVNTLKDGDSDVLRIMLEEHKNPRTGKKFTKARITHYWDGEVWQDAPELQAAPPDDPAPPTAAAGPPPGPAVPRGLADIQPAAPAQHVPEDRMKAPVPAPVNGKRKHDHLTIGYNYHIARCLCASAGVTKAELVQATTTCFIEIMKNNPLPPTAWYRNLFNDIQEGTGDDGLPF